MHTLTEHHEHLLSASFDSSYHSGWGDPGPSSYQDFQAGFDSNFLSPQSDGLLDLGGLGDELEKELGWGPSQAQNKELFVWLPSTSIESWFTQPLAIWRAIFKWTRSTPTWTLILKWGLRLLTLSLRFTAQHSATFRKLHKVWNERRHHQTQTKASIWALSKVACSAVLT